MKLATRSLCSGIGGIELGLEWTGRFETITMAECDPFCERILSSRWPGVELLPDLAYVDGECDLLTAGFPCQPVSQAGRGEATEDDRWLWPEVEDVLERCQPRYAIFENVRGLLSKGRGMAEVMAGLARLGYSAQWDLIAAFAVGAPHLRHRVFIVASREPLGRVFTGWPPRCSAWAEELGLPRLRRDVPYRTRRIRALGNSVVPQVSAFIGRALLAAIPAAPLVPDTRGPTPRPEDVTRWPRAGFLLDGRVHEVPMSCPVPFQTKAALWPTPAAEESGWPLRAVLECVDADGNLPPSWDERFYNPRTRQIVQTGLTQVVAGVEAGIWPTPAARDHKGPNPNKRDGALDLPGAVRLWPTPQARGGDRTYRRTPSQLAGEHGLYLQSEANEEARAEGEEADLPLNPSWVEWLMGYPQGWTDLDGESRPAVLRQ